MFLHSLTQRIPIPLTAAAVLFLQGDNKDRIRSRCGWLVNSAAVVNGDGATANHGSGGWWGKGGGCASSVLYSIIIIMTLTGEGKLSKLRKGMARVFALAVSSSYHHHLHGRRLLFVTLKMHRKLGAQDGKKCSESGLTISSRRRRRHPLLGLTYAHTA